VPTKGGGNRIYAPAEPKYFRQGDRGRAPARVEAAAALEPPRASTPLLAAVANDFSRSQVRNDERLSHFCRLRKTPSRPRSWANFSLSSLYSHRNAWANLHHLGQPDTFLAASPRPLARGTRIPRAGGTPAGGTAGGSGQSRARSHYRFTTAHPLYTGFTKYSAPLFLKRQCDRTLGQKTAGSWGGR
jgi:hypothetical protein